MTDWEPPSDLPPGNDVERKPLRRRVTDAWNELGPASKVAVISVAAAVVGSVIAVVHPHATTAGTDGESEAEEPGDILLAAVARILNQAAAEQDNSSSPSPWPPYTGNVRGHWRNQCLNPRGHAAGNCRHERRWVDNYTKGAAEESEEEGSIHDSRMGVA